MSISLQAIASDRFPEWLQLCRSAYEGDLRATGLSAEAAREQASASLDRAFEQGSPTPDNQVFDFIDEGGSYVGYVWVGRDHSDDPSSWWVWDIAVDETHRGKGYGKQGMWLAEAYARSQGAKSLGLSVFGFNYSARGLYESLGYETTTVKMRKQL